MSIELDENEIKAEFHLREAARLMLGKMSAISYRRRAAKYFLLQAIENCGGNQCKAARLTQIHRNTIPRILSELSIKELH